jgi:hypothetical protein
MRPKNAGKDRKQNVYITEGISQAGRVEQIFGTHHPTNL